MKLNKEYIEMADGGLWITCRDRSVAIYNLSNQGPVIGLYGREKSFCQFAVSLNEKDEAIIQLNYHGEPKFISLTDLYEMVEFHKQNKCGFVRED